MIIESLTLSHFRSYKKQSFSLAPTITLIKGHNAIGKTNILEAIYVMSTGKSFRAEKDGDMIAWNEEVTRIHEVLRDPQSTTLERITLDLVLTHGLVQNQKAPTKKYLVNGVPRRLVDFVGNSKAVHFCPEDIDLVTDSPSLRRQFLNTVLSQVDREYRRNLISYERGLRQRNSLLARISEGLASRNQLIFWDQLLIKAGSYLTHARADCITAINEIHIHDLHYNIVYDPSIISEARLDQYKDEEVAAKSTLVGPQRDDFSFIVKPRTNSKGMDKDVARFGSRGEQRLAVLWLKLSMLQFIELHTGIRPILLLDDIFSELDFESREIVLSVIDKQQTIITSAEEDINVLLQEKNVQIIQLPITT